MTIRMETMQGLHRTHGCGTISEQEVGKEVVLCGWVERRRDHGGLIFLDLRDRSGVVQVVASPDHNVESFHKAEDVRNEYVLCVRGKITKREFTDLQDLYSSDKSKQELSNVKARLQ